MAQNQDIGKQKMVKSVAKTSKQGRHIKKEVIENLSTTYSLGNPPQVGNVIQGWEKESYSNEEDNEAEEEIIDFITDPRNTRGHLSLFNQTVHTYWIMKCVLTKAMQIFHLGKENEASAVMELFQDINIQL